MSSTRSCTLNAMKDKSSFEVFLGHFKHEWVMSHLDLKSLCAVNDFRFYFKMHGELSPYKELLRREGV